MGKFADSDDTLIVACFRQELIGQLLGSAQNPEIRSSTKNEPFQLLDNVLLKKKSLIIANMEETAIQRGSRA